MSDAPKSHRGFASMSPEARVAAAPKGGAAVPAHLRSFSKSPALAASAGRKGGQVGGPRRKEPANAPD